MHILTKNISFPPLETADEDGFLAIGGDLSPERLLEAYRHGIFPWYNEEDPICWWSPDPRCIIFPEHLHVSKSMQRVINNKQFRFSVNEAFTQVMRSCSTIKRKGEHGTWIHQEMIEAYTKLHEQGFACSAEAWLDDKLVGGVYGLRMGKLFFGESMFSAVANASKFAFIKWVRLLQDEGVKLIDCQMHNSHLESLGAEMIPRATFINIINENIG